MHFCWRSPFCPMLTAQVITTYFFEIIFPNQFNHNKHRFPIVRSNIRINYGSWLYCCTVWINFFFQCTTMPVNWLHIWISLPFKTLIFTLLNVIQKKPITPVLCTKFMVENLMKTAISKSDIGTYFFIYSTLIFKISRSSYPVVPSYTGKREISLNFIKTC